MKNDMTLEPHSQSPEFLIPKGSLDSARILLQDWLSENVSGLEKDKIAQKFIEILRDPDVVARKSLAYVLSKEGEAPHHLVISLARDHIDVATPILLYSPVLSDHDLIDLIREGDIQTIQVIASRNELSSAVISVLVEKGNRDSCLNLLQDPENRISQEDLSRIAEQYIDDVSIRKYLLGHPQLPISIRQRLITTLCDAVIEEYAAGASCLSARRLQSAVHETWERMILEMSRTLAGEDHNVLIAYLYELKKLTPGLLLRALIFGDLTFFESALAFLARVPRDRAHSLIMDCTGFGFRALCIRAGFSFAFYRGLVFVIGQLLLFLKGGSYSATARSRCVLLKALVTSYRSQVQPKADPMLSFFTKLYDEASLEEAGRTVSGEGV